MTDLLDPDMEEKEERREAASKEARERLFKEKKGPPAKWGPNANNIRVLPRDQLDEINAQVTI